MSFDAIAPHYRWLEWMTAGSLLQRCRTAFISEVREARKVLLLGEGRGRFLVELLTINPDAEITCVDASLRMLKLMRRTLRMRQLPEKRVRFVHGDLLRAKSRATVPAASNPDRRNTCDILDEAVPFLESYDAIASHFFLDCFRPDQLQRIATIISEHTDPGARWLISDFCVPDRGWQRIRARLIHASMYAFFQVVTRLPASRLTPPDAFLRDAGFELAGRRYFNFGLLHSDVWMRRVDRAA